MSEKMKNKKKNPGTPEQKKKRRRKRIAVGAGALAAALAAFAVRVVFFAKETVPTVPVSVVRKQSITSRVDTSGTVVSLKEKTYFSPVNADIREYDLKVGSTVRRGDLLVAFDTDSLERDDRRAELSAASSIGGSEDTLQKNRRLKNEAASAKDRIAVIEGNIDEYKRYIRELSTAIAERSRELAGGDAAASDISSQMEGISDALAAAVKKETLEEASEKYRAEIDSLEVEMSQAQFGSDEATAAILQKQIEAREKQIRENESEIGELKERMGTYADMSAADLEAALSGNPAVSGAPVDPSVDADITRWQLDLSAAREELSELQSDLAEEKARVEAGDDAEMTDGAKRAMESGDNLAELESATAEELLELGKKGIHADFPGIITKADLTQGAPATQGMELVTIASSEEMAVSATVSKYDYSDLRVGQKATIDIGSHTYTGRVSSVSRVASLNEKNSPMITCEVRLDEPDEYVFLGVEARVTIVTARKKGALTIPMEALNTGREGVFCYVLEDGRIVRRNVTVGVSSADSTEILSGLKEGDQVITAMPGELKEGMEAAPEGHTGEDSDAAEREGEA